MIASPQAAKQCCVSESSTIKVLTKFLCRLLVRERVIELFSHDYFRPGAAQREWLSSPISRFTHNCFDECKSLTSMIFESHSKMQQIEDFPFSGSRLRTIHIPA
jgi:hypothetical protein